jgi:hypothetical protein
MRRARKFSRLASGHLSGHLSGQFLGHSFGRHDGAVAGDGLRSGLIP